MTLIAILTGTLAAGIGSVWLAALLSFGMLARYTHPHAQPGGRRACWPRPSCTCCPKPSRAQAGAQELFAMLLVGLVFFFLLDKAEL